MKDANFNKLVLFVNAIVPLSLLGWDAANASLGANPIEFFLRTTGVLTLLFLVLTLAVTPLRKRFGWNGLIKYRRMLGLFAFFYGCVHLSTYFIFDRSLNLSGTVADVVQRPFIAFGMTAFVLMVPLAITSTNGMIKRIGGKNWQKLHRLTYIAAAAGVVHFWMIVKSDVFYPAIFGAILVLLLGYRLVAGLQKRSSPRARASQV
jgi:sulfoxide reductase heme-binding subunit YedZ